MSVRAKFRLNSYKTESHFHYPHKDEAGREDYSRPERVEKRTLYFAPVYGNGDPNHENTKFWNASPNGSLELGTVNPDAWVQFELDKEYYLDFTPAEG